MYDTKAAAFLGVEYSLRAHESRKKYLFFPSV